MTSFDFQQIYPFGPNSPSPIGYNKRNKMSMSKNTEINRNIKRKLAMGGVVGDYALYDPATEMQLTGARW